MMNLHKDIIYAAKDIVSHYSHFDGDQFTLNFNQIPSFHIEELTSLIMEHDDAYASEATGPDNDWYLKFMKPSLVNFLKNTSDKDAKFEFVNNWKDGVTHYFENCIKDLLEEQLIKLNQSHGYVDKHDYDCPRDNGKESRPW